MNKVIIITQIRHRAKCYFTSVTNVWYIAFVPNMNKITTFFCDTLQQALKLYEKMSIINQIWYRVKSYLQCMVADYCTNYKQYHHILL